MTIQDLGSIGEFVAALATVATLIYLALQLRHNGRVSRFDSHLKARQLVAESQRVLSDPDKAKLWRVGLSDPDALTEDERLSFFSILYLVANALDARLEYIRATRDPDPYETQGNILEYLAPQPGFQRWWKHAARTYNAEMNAYVEQHMQAEPSKAQPPL